MKINLEPYITQEIEIIKQLFLRAKDKSWEQVDVHAINKKILEQDIYLVLYPELLQYDYTYNVNNKRISEERTDAWVACQIELNDDLGEDKHIKILKELRSWVENNIPIKPFHDEDATLGMFAKKCSAYSREYTEYVFYLNIHYKDGWWENHTLS